MNTPVRVVNAVIRDQEGRLLLCKKRDFWTLPGGKAEAGETDEQTLRREVAEEVVAGGNAAALEGAPEAWRNFDGVAPSGKAIAVRAHFARIVGETVAARPGDSVTEARFCPEPLALPLSETTRRMVEALLQEGRIR